MQGELSIGAILARVRGRSTPPPAPAPRAPRAAGGAMPVRRVARNQGYDLVVGSERAVGVQPSGGGWVVHNVGAGHRTTLDCARSADALAARIARLMALP